MASAPTHHQAVTTLLTSSRILVGVGIFMVESLKMLAKRGTTKVSRSTMDVTPTPARRAG